MTNHHNASPDVVIVGGGVIGLAVAWRAAQRGLKITVLERERPGAGTSRVAAGMIAPISEARNTEQPLLRLGLASARAYPAFVGELTEASGRDPGYLACGTIAAARDHDDAEALDRELAMRRAPRTSGAAAALDRGSPFGTGHRSAAAPCARDSRRPRNRPARAGRVACASVPCGWAWSCGSVRRWPGFLSPAIASMACGWPAVSSWRPIRWSSRPACGRARWPAFPTTRASRSGRSRGRSCACTIRPDRDS